MKTKFTAFIDIIKVKPIRLKGAVARYPYDITTVIIESFQKTFRVDGNIKNFNWFLQWNGVNGTQAEISVNVKKCNLFYQCDPSKMYVNPPVGTLSNGTFGIRTDINLPFFTSSNKIHKIATTKESIPEGNLLSSESIPEGNLLSS